MSGLFGDEEPALPEPEGPGLFGDALPAAPAPAPPQTAAPMPSNNGGGGGTRAVANGAPRMQAEPAIAVPAGPVLSSFRDVAALVAERREPTLHAHLVHSVHLVRFAPPVIEICPEPDTPRDLAARLSALLGEATGIRWTIALSAGPGEPTLAEQGDAADQARRRDAAHHPLVMAILKAFPGAKIEAVRDSALDDYGLTAVANLGGEGELSLERFR
eukprot:gene12872-12972_t